MNQFEDIFDIALTRLHSGEQIDSIIKDYPEHAKELVSLLSVSEIGFNVPKRISPRPYKRQLYAEKVTALTRFWATFGNYRTAAIPIALLISLLGGRSIVSATESSLPGDTLYTLKRATETARLTFTRNPEKLAVIHVELLQRRVDEVRKAADSGDEEAETAAIAELQSQTTKTFAEAAPVATANALSRQDSTLLESLVAINKEQKDVLQNLTENETDTGTKDVANTALADNKKNDETLAKIIATVNDQTLADLQNKISITGTIAAHYGNKITVEKNTFTIDDRTTLTTIEGEVTTPKTTLTGRVTITGVREDNGVLIAKQILLLPSEGDVKGATDSAPVTSVKAPVKVPVKTTEPVTPTPTPTDPTTQPAPAPNQATGSFIVEPSDQQYSGF